MPNQKQIEQDLINDVVGAQGAVSYMGTGGVMRAILRAFSFAIDGVWYEHERTRRSLFLATAMGDELDVLGEERGIARQGANAAGVVLSFNGPDTTPIPATTKVRSASGIIFETTDVIIIGTMNPTLAGELHAYPLGDKVLATATTTGSVGNVPADSITEITPPIVGVSCNNHYPAQNGRDVESDSHYRVRIVQAAASLERNTITFFTAIARACSTISAGGGTIGDRVLRVKPARGPSRTVFLHIITKDGAGLVAADRTNLAAYVQDYCNPLTTIVVENVVFTAVDVVVTISLDGSKTLHEVLAGAGGDLGIADVLANYLDWSVWNWGGNVDDSQLLALCRSVKGISTGEGIDLSTFEPIRDVEVDDYSVPRVHNLTVHDADAVYPSENYTIETSYSPSILPAL